MTSSMPPLEALGWSARFAEAFESAGVPGGQPARVLAEFQHIYRLYHAAGEIAARVAGRLRHRLKNRAEFPVVGDWVVVRRQGDEGPYVIAAVLPRQSRFARKVAGAVVEEQTVAANVDTVFLLTGLDADFSLRRIERYLVTARDSGARPVVLLNKADLVEDEAARVAEVETVAQGVPVHAISCKTPGGLAPIEPYLRPGETVALLGSSGVGKSTLVNRLLGEERLRTRDVRASDETGRHTTTNRELLLLPGGALVIDTPGMRELQLWTAGDGVRETFDDIEQLAPGCRFGDCAHDTEPGCAVRAAVGEGRLAADRLESYHKLRRELARLERDRDAAARKAHKRREASVHHFARDHRPRE